MVSFQHVHVQETFLFEETLERIFVATNLVFEKGRFISSNYIEKYDLNQQD